MAKYGKDYPSTLHVLKEMNEMFKTEFGKERYPLKKKEAAKEKDKE